LRQDRPADGGTGFLGREARAMSAPDRRARVERPGKDLSVRRQCALLSVARSWVYKLHKTQLASDRTSCRSALANRVRLVLHTAAYWLMLAVRDAIPKARDLAKAEFATLRLKLLKIAARVVEMASRVRLALAAYPEADL